MKQGTFVTEKNIYEFLVEESIFSHNKYTISYIKSGQPTTHVIEKLFSKSQIENDNNIIKAILEHEGENQ